MLLMIYKLYFNFVLFSVNFNQLCILMVSLLHDFDIKITFWGVVLYMYYALKKEDFLKNILLMFLIFHK